MGCSIRQIQLNELDRAMGVMRRAGIPASADPFAKLYQLRQQIAPSLGIKLPRSITSLIRLIGLSPGSITLWHDVEAGWMSEGRAHDGAPPVYHWINDDQAITLLTGGLTKELELELLEQDDYLGE